MSVVQLGGQPVVSHIPDEFRNVIKSLECNISENQITEVRDRDRDRERGREADKQRVCVE